MIAAELPALGAQCGDAARGSKFEALYVLSLTTGLRMGEALGLRWSDIDFHAKTLRVSRQLQRVRDGGGLVFSEPGEYTLEVLFDGTVVHTIPFKLQLRPQRPAG